MTASQEVYRDKSGEWRWRIKAGNGEIIASGESHRDRRDAERALDTALDTFQELQKGMADLPVADAP